MIVQIVWDIFMLRRSIRDSSLTWRKGIFSTELVSLGYLILVPAAALYDRHQQYKPLFIVAILLTAIGLIFLIGLGLYCWKHSEKSGMKSCGRLTSNRKALNGVLHRQCLNA